MPTPLARRRRSPLLPALSAALLAAGAASAQDRIAGAPFATRSEVFAQHGIAATSQPLATQVAVDVLQAGGTAVDAAIAANAVLGLVEPTGCGIGGDLFAIVWDPEEGRVFGYNGSGRSPRSLTRERLVEEITALRIEETRRAAAKGSPIAIGTFEELIIPPHGPLPVSVPGAVDGWCALHARFGRIPLTDVLAPAIRAAREGAPITQTIAYYWNRSAPVLSKYPGFEDTFLPKGRAPRAGEVFANPSLARTYERIAEHGRDGFYAGETARELADFMAEHGGYLTEEDLAEHAGEWVEPVSVNYRGYDVWELPPNGQGIAALQMLQILEGYDLRAMGFGSADYVHAFTEAKKLAFEDRARFYADPAFAPAPVAALLSDEYAARQRATIGQKASETITPLPPTLEEGDTIYLCTADADGMMVSLIQSNYRGMGSGMTPPGLGFCLQDRGQLFDLVSGRPNSYAPGKRPFHTIMPGFATVDGEPWMSFGVMGGAMQPQGQTQVLVNRIDFGCDLQEAG
ncbi:MAG: gamma-glutamyltransferase family protein, partial [Planctomycetota bacterium]